jgi:endonuclease-3
MPVVTSIAKRRKDPFRVLISTILSLRTKDEVTGEASTRLFKIARTPGRMAAQPAQKIKNAIYPVGFYKTKAKTIIDVSRILKDKYNSRVPNDLDELLAFKGVGRKTANLVLTRGYGLHGICVDTHVHRISNRLGIVRTRYPDETEMKLRKILPKRYWIIFNDLLVAYGQNLCRPLNPMCSVCKISHLCKKAGVIKHR